MKKTTMLCDICGSVGTAEQPIKEALQVPVTFMTDQVEGRSIAPYLQWMTIDICEADFERIRIFQPLIGSEGNSYSWNKRLSFE